MNFSLKIPLLFLGISLCAVICPSDCAAQAELEVVKNKWIKYSDLPNLLYHHLAEDAYRLLDKEAVQVAAIKIRADWQRRQREKKAAIWKQIGGFKEKTPLNARITSVIRKEGFRIENLIYESLPGYYVTASLFIPDAPTSPAPAILFCSGHSAQAYRRDVYQLPLQNLVKKGFVVLAIDPVSQGERLQYLNPSTGESEIGSSTGEHSYPAVQSFLIGQSVARYFVWDGIRGIDYLISRKEVDPARIGVHGLSGGGTQAAYIGALDDRVLASAPCGYITGFKRLIESIGAQDGEQNFYHGIKEGIDHADMLEIRAPKPTLIMATTRDFFNISGTQDVFRRVKKLYQLFGAGENLEMVEGDYEHGYEQTIREGMYAFFQKHLKMPGSPRELPITLLTVEELRKTPTGQVATSFARRETVFTLNKRESALWIGRLQKAREGIATHQKQVVSAARQYSGFRAPSGVGSPVFTGRIHRSDYVIERYFLKGEGDYPIPYLLFVPAKPSGKTIIYLHPGGKAQEASGEIERLVKEGLTVLAPDLLGVGELISDRFKGDASIEGISYNVWFTAALTGRSIVGVHASDLIRLVNWVKQTAPGEEIWGIARDEMGPSLLHAMAFDSRISGAAVVGMYSSYQAVVENERYKPKFVYSMVPGALRAYDLPDLAAAVAPRPLLLANFVDSNGRLLDSAEMSAASAVAGRYYEINHAAHFLKTMVDPDPMASVMDWLRKN
ncbi:alpha/beta hydrolase family protein [Ravibacter arvi]|uniref:Alpha/beta hydrolase family protein n=1 Tax=Ravibacter arvi TaxID=2051041 RepID=A0ABP8M0B0_9BACT